MQRLPWIQPMSKTVIWRPSEAKNALLGAFSSIHNSNMGDYCVVHLFLVSVFEIGERMNEKCCLQTICWSFWVLDKLEGNSNNNLMQLLVCLKEEGQCRLPQTFLEIGEEKQKPDIGYERRKKTMNLESILSFVRKHVMYDSLMGYIYTIYNIWERDSNGRNFSKSQCQILSQRLSCF